MSEHQEKPIISIVIPVYNVDMFLRKALQSVADQTFQNFEAIIVDDGSTDGCPEIIAEYVRKYPNFKSVRQENAGLSAARNTGLTLAQGEYIAFMDSDDYYELTFLEEMYRACIENDCDISYCSFYFYFPYNGFRLRLPMTSRTAVHDSRIALSLLIHDKFMHHFAWNKLYKRSLFVENRVTFTQMYFEDVATSPRLYYHAKKVAVSSKPLYNYTRRRGSILKSMNAKKINDFISTLGFIRNFLEEADDFQAFQRPFNKFARKMKVINWYSVLRLHVITFNFKGFWKNIKSNNRSVRYFMSNDYRPQQGLPSPPFPIVQPKRRGTE